MLKGKILAMLIILLFSSENTLFKSPIPPFAKGGLGGIIYMPYAMSEQVSKEEKEMKKKPEVVPLRDVMLELIGYYHGLFIGIFMKDQSETAIFASKGLAKHMSPTGGFKHYIKKGKERIEEAEKLDKEVQDLAAKMAKAFEAKRIEEAVTLLNEMNLRCVKCHQIFRE